MSAIAKRRNAGASGRRRASVGRPRAIPGAETGNARNDIVVAASKLFRERGYAGTSIQAIASEAGLRKASIYYYFARKEDILGAMIEDVMRPPLELIERLERSMLSPAARLYRFLAFDMRQLCEAPYDYSWFLTMIETRSDRFADFWNDREKLLMWIEATIRDGIALGQFVKIDVAMAARTLFAMDEFTVTWFEKESPDPAKDVADFVAGLALRSILNRSAELSRVQAELALERPPRKAS